MKCTARVCVCVWGGGALISKRNARHEVSETLITSNRRRKHYVPKCSVRMHHPYFIFIL